MEDFLPGLALRVVIRKAFCHGLAWTLLAITAMIVAVATGSLSHAASGHHFFRWSEDFEGDDPVTLIHAYGNRIVHFPGPTTSMRHQVVTTTNWMSLFPPREEADSGRSPLEGTLMLRGRTRMDQAPPGRSNVERRGLAPAALDAEGGVDRPARDGPTGSVGAERHDLPYRSPCH